MFLYPKKTKYKKIRKGNLIKFKNQKLVFGYYGLKATQSGIVSARQLEAARQAISRKIKRKGKIWLRLFPNYPVTKKPTEVRMGKGKGSVQYWASKVGIGTIIFEITGISENIANKAFKTGSAKLPIKTIVIK